MLFTSSSMLSRAVTKMEPMGLETAGTLQHCTFLCDSYSSFSSQPLTVWFFYALANFVFVGVAMILALVQPYKAEFAIYNAVDSVFVLTMAL